MKRRRAGKVRVTAADGSTEVVGPGHFQRKRLAKRYKQKKTGYARYLASDHWQEIRKRILDRDQHKCQSCGSRKKLQVHHLTYVRFGGEHPSDLTTLCDRCHRRLHG